MPKDQLRQLGFSAKEADIYLALLQVGKATPAQLAELTGINRTTVYSVSRELLKRGVIAEDVTGKQRQLLAQPPDELTTLVAKEEKEIEEKKAVIAAAVTELEKFAKDTKYSIPKITFVSEDELEDYLYKRTPEWNRSLLERDPTWWGYQDDTFVANYGAWISWYWEQGTQPGIDLKLLSIETEIENEMQAKGYTNRTIKYWEGLKVDATTWINGDYVIMIVTNQRPHYLVEIHDATLARNQRAVFKRIWQALEQGSIHEPERRRRPSA